MASTAALSLAAPRQDTAIPVKHVRALRIWLGAIALLIVAMILVGGATRLTDSGLSITEWQPMSGTMPPLSEADWQEAFEAYQKIPEYTELKRGMSLDQFKTIYWWEWTHRFLGRLIGVAFFVPFVAFWIAGYIPRALLPRLIGLFLLGGFQGAIGWYMVKSGLVERTDVSQYRLAAHFGMALAHPRLHALAPVRPWRASRSAARTRAARGMGRGRRAGADLRADAGRRAGCRARRRHGLQHLAADRRRLRALGPGRQHRPGISTCSRTRSPCSSTTACWAMRVVLAALGQLVWLGLRARRRPCSAAR